MVVVFSPFPSIHLKTQPGTHRNSYYYFFKATGKRWVLRGCKLMKINKNSFSKFFGLRVAPRHFCEIFPAKALGRMKLREWSPQVGLARRSLDFVDHIWGAYETSCHNVGKYHFLLGNCGFKLMKMKMNSNLFPG